MIELDDAAELAPGRLVEVAPDTWMLPLSLRLDSSPAATLCYLIRDAEGGIHVVDPGEADDGDAAIVLDAVARIGGPAGIASILVTHGHVDHLGGARVLRTRSDAPVRMHAAEARSVAAFAIEPEEARRRGRARARDWGAPESLTETLADWSASRVAGPFVPDALLADGELLDIPGRRIRVLHTPGHTPGHVCLLDEELELLFSGDHLLPFTYSGIGLGAAAERSPIDDYLDSIRAVAALGEPSVLPGHELRFRGLGERAARIVGHHERRAAAVAEVLRAEPEASVWEIAAQLPWSAGWAGLRGFELPSALLQTELHRARQLGTGLPERVDY